MARIRAGIINVTGYIGSDLARLLYQHPQVELKSVTGRSAAGQKLGDALPYLNETRLLIEDKLDNDIDVVFSAMPHKSSVDIVPALLKKGIKVIDVSADFRLQNASEYLAWYGFNHPAPQLLGEAIYGLPELHRSEIISADLIANPGCYSTSAILALAPMVKEELISSDIIIDSKSGVSGAGRSLSLVTHYSEANESTCAYSIEGHRHLPEIKQELERLSSGSSLAITFVPHLVPMTRGILSSCYASLKKGWLNESAQEKLQQLYREFYKNAPFIRIMSKPPQTKYAWGNNSCFIYPTVDLRTERFIVISCLDNLVKGGAGQAVQNMNLMFNLSETTGLTALAIYP
ncbi:MAG: N-acetyl-gamma-glutamyl-phosphate reductase [Dehalococcoidia bacterium]|nr:N-acetyl-gamma-glutamyl-phosphate reductase [Dehalococcoidia bacterium]